MISVELVLAPGVTDSASTLSCPHTNELANSVIKDYVYFRVGSEDREKFSALGSFGVFDVDVDFRKRLYIATRLYGAPGSRSGRHQIWGCKCRYRHYVGSDIHWFPLANFNVSEFKSVSALARRFKFSKLIANFIDGHEAQGSRPYPTIPPQLDFPTYIESFSHQTTETVRVCTVSHGT